MCMLTDVSGGLGRCVSDNDAVLHVAGISLTIRPWRVGPDRAGGQDTWNKLPQEAAGGTGFWTEA